MKKAAFAFYCMLTVSSFAFDYESYLLSIFEHTRYSGKAYTLSINDLQSELENELGYKKCLFQSEDSLVCNFSNELYQYDFNIHYKIQNDHLEAIPDLLNYVYDSTNFLNSDLKSDFNYRNVYLLNALMYYQAIKKKEQLINLEYQDQLSIPNATKIELSLIGDSINTLLLRKTEIGEFKKYFIEWLGEDEQVWCEFVPYVTASIISEMQSCELQICFSCDQAIAICSNGKRYSYSFTKSKKMVDYFNTKFKDLSATENFHTERDLEEDILRLQKKIAYLKYLSQED